MGRSLRRAPPYLELARMPNGRGLRSAPQNPKRCANNSLTIGPQAQPWRGSMEGTQMPQQIERNSFGPRELKNLGRAFEAAWKKLRADGIDESTLEETDLVRTKLAQWIIAYAKMRELDVKRLKENGLMGLRWSKEFSRDH
jgi:hypothetical protein